MELCIDSPILTKSSPGAHRWIPSSARVVAVGSFPRGSGCIQVHELKGPELELSKEAEKPSSFRCATFGASSIRDRHLATGNFTGDLQVWDLERLAEPVYSAKANREMIYAIDGCGGQALLDDVHEYGTFKTHVTGKGPPELVTGGGDGAVRVWDVRQPDTPVAAFPPDAICTEKAPECWSVAFGNAFNDEERCVLAGYANGDLRLFDLRTGTERWSEKLQNGVCTARFDRADIPMNKLLTAGLDGRYCVYDARTQHPQQARHDFGFAGVSGRLARGATLWAAAPLPQNRDLWAAATGDGSLHLYRYHYPDQRSMKDSQGREYGVAGTVEELAQASLSTQPLSAFDWCPERAGLFCCGALDQVLRVGLVTGLPA
ncbi:WD repeat-containing protein 92 [Coccomyxa sp. Obi]|nr:WD repeat-containing protein 92 [Coccomyxa sp. Obi]